MFGGLGHNIFNPALVGRAVVFVSWASYMAGNYVKSATIGIANTAAHKTIIAAVDAANGATPLAAAMKVIYDPVNAVAVPHGAAGVELYKPLLLANPWGVHGRGLGRPAHRGRDGFIYTRVIDLEDPRHLPGTVAVLTAISGRDPLFYTLAGGLLLGAIFMATDYTTSPMSGKGKVIFGLGLGLTTFLLRFWSNSAEAVMFSILFMNALVPMIDRFVLPRTYGKVRGKKEAVEA